MPMMIARRCCVILIVFIGVASAEPPAWVRVDNVGYAPDEKKVAVLLCDGQVKDATFSVVDGAGNKALSAAVPEKSQNWNKQAGVLIPLEFTAVTGVGTYTIVVDGPHVHAVSPAFRVAAADDLYVPLVGNAASFYAAQHDAHTADAAATIYNTPRFKGNALAGTLKAIGGPVDVSGGWYDAGDYVEFVETASYADAALLLAVRDHPNAALTAEARYGLQWLLKMWVPASGTLYYQIGVGDGNDAVQGDHDAWRLPAVDNALNVAPGDPQYFQKFRPVFATAGPISPNLAGRLAAAFALGSQVFRSTDAAFADRCLQGATSVFAAAKTQGVKTLLTTAPFEYYSETEWRDDMEWGAAELYLATAEAAFLQQSATWAKAYLNSPDGGDTPNLYDVGGIAHYELAKAFAVAGNPAGLDVSRKDLLDAMRGQLEQALGHSAKDLFQLGLTYKTGDLTPHVIGLAVEAAFYDELTGTNTFAPLVRSQRHWVLGNNAWGVSFIVGAGSLFPKCIHHQIANLTATDLTGAVVDGPNGEKEVAQTLKEIPDGARTCPADKSDPYKIFTAQGVRFADTVAAYPCVEPALDYTALTPLLFNARP